MSSWSMCIHKACALDHLLHDGAGVMTVNEAQSASCPQGADICLENEGQRATRMSSISSKCVY